MDIALFNINGGLFLVRWLHIFFGVIWIGLLYYFNFVQGAFFAETDATTKSNAIQKLLPRALYWFRWGAMWTLVTGIIYLEARRHQMGAGAFANQWGVCILTGAALGITMWFNVWFVIWPNQKIVIESTTLVAQGKTALPTAAAAATRALVASRTNTLFSIPMLFFMAAAPHLPINIGPEYKFGLLSIVLGLLWAGLEFNALKGKTGPMTTIKGVIHSGFALTAVIYIIIEMMK